MVKEIVFASSNLHKTTEVSKILGSSFKVLNLLDIHCTEEIAETGNSFEENASIKSTYVKEKFGFDCFADDSGLEVLALNNEPGIYSARYAGTKIDADNIHLLLKNMEGITDRRAQFKTVISLVLHNQTYFFEGIIKGVITTAAKGTNGFGYDSIFIPENFTQTFAELDSSLKSKISHRAIAVNKMTTYLKNKF